jgi:hypothetical protein
MQLKERIGWRKAVVALANWNARLAWAALVPESRREPSVT